MEETISQALGVQGEVVGIIPITKTRGEWIQQARDTMDRAEKYGASTPNQMRSKEKEDLRQALTALGQNPQF